MWLNDFTIVKNDVNSFINYVNSFASNECIEKLKHQLKK